MDIFVTLLPMVGNPQLLYRLRWIAVLFQLGILSLVTILKLPVILGLYGLGMTIQLGTNAWAFYALKRKFNLSEISLFFQLILDLISLNIFVISSGGLANPFSGLFLIQAVLGAILLSGLRLWIMIGAAGLSYTVLLLGFNPNCENHHQWMVFHIQGMILNHIITTIVIGYFVFRIIRNLKLKEHQLSARQGLIGAGATAAQIAHKIGTPLNSMALITQDLSITTLDRDRIRLLQEIEKCKAFLSRFFSHLNRLENTGGQKLFSLHAESFTKRMTQYPSLSLTHTISKDRMISTLGVELIILILEIMAENAAEAKANNMHFEAQFSKNYLELKIQNDGPPLPDEIQSLMNIGYTQDKGIHHTGIGLFLVRLVIESLGATVQVEKSRNVSILFKFPLENIEFL
ncbi:sensor histidine kinase [bacterium]|nr:sensor histidine kinase [bacterium]